MDRLDEIQIETVDEHSGIEATIAASPAVLAECIGRQGIDFDVENSEFFFLAAIALETAYDEDYAIEDTLMEFVRNAAAFEHLSRGECDGIEELLRE